MGDLEKFGTTKTMTDLFIDCLSDFQKNAVCKTYQVLREGKVSEFNATIVMPSLGMEEYGLAIKLSVGDEYPIAWINQESYQFIVEENAPYGKIVEVEDTDDDLQQLMKSFKVDLRNYFAF